MSVSTFGRATGLLRRALTGSLPGTISGADFAALLPRYLKGELSEWQQLAVELRIKRCRACREALLAGRGPAEPWLRRLELRRAQGSRRKAGFEPPIEGLLPAFDGDQRRSARAVAHPPSGETCLASLAERLPEGYRIVWQLHDIEDMSVGQVAKVLDLTEDSVRARLHKARAALTTLSRPLPEGEA